MKIPQYKSGLLLGVRPSFVVHVSRLLAISNRATVAGKRSNRTNSRMSFQCPLSKAGNGGRGGVDRVKSWVSDIDCTAQLGNDKLILDL